MTSKIYPHFIKDTERTVYIRKVSPRLTQELLNLHHEPPPPVNTVTYSDGRTVEEPNRADPQYAETLKAYRMKLIDAVNELLIERGVIVELSDEDKNEVAELRAYWQSTHGQPLTGSDRFVFVNYIAVGTPDDLGELVQAITRRSQATAEATQAALDSFPGGVQGPSD